mmetsp:Transcript_50516/g.142008  ORF Transcript_50516/g.142008 Transcript_50516/m.142008 type:complete len:246 (-) Transcript_50516:79-816(-)
MIGTSHFKGFASETKQSFLLHDFRVFFKGGPSNGSFIHPQRWQDNLGHKLGDFFRISRIIEFLNLGRRGTIFHTRNNIEFIFFVMSLSQNTIQSMCSRRRQDIVGFDHIGLVHHSRQGQDFRMFVVGCVFKIVEFIHAQQVFVLVFGNFDDLIETRDFTCQFETCGTHFETSFGLLSGKFRCVGNTFLGKLGSRSDTLGGKFGTFGGYFGGLCNTFDSIFSDFGDTFCHSLRHTFSDFLKVLHGG